jgi:hypothetical protein
VAASITANTIPVTQQAQQIFVQNTEDLTQVRETVNSALSELTYTGLDPIQLDQVISPLQQWQGGLNDIIETSTWMAEMLGNTWRLIQKNEQDNVDLASGVTVQQEPAGERMPAWSGDTTLEPGQTVGLRQAVEDPLL